MNKLTLKRTDSTTLGLISNNIVGIKISPRYKLEKINNLDKEFKKIFINHINNTIN